MKAVFIYALKDPITGAIRYIGKSVNPKRRFLGHLGNIKKNHYCANWIRSLKERGLRPELEILAQVPESEWPQWEIDYIEAFRSLGCDLVNFTRGGDSGPAMPGNKHPMFGKKHTSKAKEKNRIAHLGKIAWNRGLTGGQLSLAHRAKISASLRGNKRNLGKKLSSETRAKISEKTKGEKNPFYGKTFTSESLAKMSAAQIGKKHSLETREKIRVSTLANPNSGIFKAGQIPWNKGNKLRA